MYFMVCVNTHDLSYTQENIYFTLLKHLYKHKKYNGTAITSYTQTKLSYSSHLRQKCPKQLNIFPL